MCSLDCLCSLSCCQRTPQPLPVSLFVSPAQHQLNLQQAIAFVNSGRYPFAL